MHTSEAFGTPCCQDQTSSGQKLACPVQLACQSEQDGSSRSPTLDASLPSKAPPVLHEVKALKHLLDNWRRTPEAVKRRPQHFSRKGKVPAAVSSAPEEPKSRGRRRPASSALQRSFEFMKVYVYGLLKMLVTLTQAGPLTRSSCAGDLTC